VCKRILLRSVKRARMHARVVFKAAGPLWKVGSQAHPLSKVIRPSMNSRVPGSPVIISHHKRVEMVRRTSFSECKGEEIKYTDGGKTLPSPREGRCTHGCIMQCAQSTGILCNVHKAQAYCAMCTKHRHIVQCAQSTGILCNVHKAQAYYAMCTMHRQAWSPCSAHWP